MPCVVKSDDAVLTSDEQRITSKDSTIITIFEEETDAVLGMTRRVEGLHFDPADAEGLAVTGRFGNFGAVAAADDGDGKGLELGDWASAEGMQSQCVGLWVYHFGVASCVVVVAVTVKYMHWRGGRRAPYWCVLMMLLSFAPSFTAFFTVGRTLQ